MRSKINAKLILTCVVMLLWYQLGLCETPKLGYIETCEYKPSTEIVDPAELRYVRVGKHETFTRIVFEFQDSVRSLNPLIKGGDKLSVVFLNATTFLPKQILTNTTERIGAIELFQQKTDLRVNIVLSSPFFRIKSFFLSNPERVVLDVYWVGSLPEDIVLEEFARENLSKMEVSEFTPTLTTESHKKSQIKRADIREVEPIISKETAMDEGQLKKSESKTVSPEEACQASNSEYEALCSFLKHDYLQTYLLAIHIILTVFIIALVSFMLFQKRSVVESLNQNKNMSSSNRTDRIIATIDAKIKEELKKYDKY